jgi:hypothetical protein
MAAGRLSGLHTAFLCLDRDITPMNLGGLAIFRPAQPPDPGRIACLLADRAQRHPCYAAGAAGAVCTGRGDVGRRFWIPRCGSH